jgi:hypothetical protein
MLFFTVGDVDCQRALGQAMKLQLESADAKPVRVRQQRHPCHRAGMAVLDAKPIEFYNPLTTVRRVLAKAK